MKVTKSESKSYFKPINVTITLESQQEFDGFITSVDYLAEIFNSRISSTLNFLKENGDDQEAFANAMKQIYEIIS